MIGAYFLCLIFLTLKSPKAAKNVSFEDFYTGSKSMGAIVVGLVMLVTYYSGTTWSGWTGFTALNGMFGAYVIPYGVSAAVGMYLLASKIWPLGKEFGLSTLADLYELRYRSTGLKIMTGAIGAVMNVTWITMEIVTIGYIIKIATGGQISSAMGSLIGVVFMTAYTLWGGIKSVSSVNTFQSALMVIGAIGVILYVVFYNYGSISNMFEIALKLNPNSFILTGDGIQGQWFSFVLLCSIGVLCYPSLYLKMYLGKNTNEIKKSAIFNAAGGFWCVLIIFGGFAIISYQTVSGVVIDNAEEGLLLILQQSGNSFMFGLACIFILAACMGTVDGTLLAISGILSSDVISGFKKISRKEPPIGEPNYTPSAASQSDNVVLWTRIIVVIIAICAYVITLFNLPLLVLIAMINYQGIAQLFIPMVGAVLWKKATKAGTYGAILSGFGITIALMIMNLNPMGLLPGVWGVLIGTIIYVVGSYATYNENLPEAKIYDVLLNTMAKYR